MASNLSTIGFTFIDDASFEATMVKLANQAQQRLATDQGEYAIWRSRTGAEIWFHLGARDPDDGAGVEGGERAIMGLAPFYEGESDVRIAATELVKRPDDNALEGLVHAWVAPDESGIGSYPIVYEAVDFAAVAARELPVECRCRIACFCREISVFDSVDSLLASEQGQEGPKLAAQSLVPVGLFGELEEAGNEADDEDGDPTSPAPTVLIRGIVKAHRRQTNEITGHAFHWMLVETLDATLDVLADADLVEREPREGSAIEAYAWLFGRTIA